MHSHQGAAYKDANLVFFSSGSCFYKASVAENKLPVINYYVPL